MPRSYHLDLHEMAQINAGTWFEGSSLIPLHWRRDLTAFEQSIHHILQELHNEEPSKWPEIEYFQL